MAVDIKFYIINYTGIKHGIRGSIHHFFFFCEEQLSQTEWS